MSHLVRLCRCWLLSLLPPHCLVVTACHVCRRCSSCSSNICLHHLNDRALVVSECGRMVVAMFDPQAKVAPSYACRNWSFELVANVAPAHGWAIVASSKVEESVCSRGEWCLGEMGTSHRSMCAIPTADASHVKVWACVEGHQGNRKVVSSCRKLHVLRFVIAIGVVVVMWCVCALWLQYRVHTARSICQ